MSPALLLLSGAICVLGAGALGVSAILAEQKQRRRFHERLELVSASYVRVNPLVVMGRAAGRRRDSGRGVYTCEGE